ncbi:hypothetical protein ABZ479_16515 [Streptomyces sp. NPDC005722]
MFTAIRSPVISGIHRCAPVPAGVPLVAGLVPKVEDDGENAAADDGAATGEANAGDADGVAANSRMPIPKTVPVAGLLLVNFTVSSR